MAGVRFLENAWTIGKQETQKQRLGWRGCSGDDWAATCSEAASTAIDTIMVTPSKRHLMESTSKSNPKSLAPDTVGERMRFYALTPNRGF